MFSTVTECILLNISSNFVIVYFSTVKHVVLPYGKQSDVTPSTIFVITFIYVYLRYLCKQ